MESRSDTLAEHKDQISEVERAWNYARYVAYVNTGKHHTPAELMQIKENDYEALAALLRSTGKPDCERLKSLLSLMLVPHRYLHTLWPAPLYSQILYLPFRNRDEHKKRWVQYLLRKVQLLIEHCLGQLEI